MAKKPGSGGKPRRRARRAPRLTHIARSSVPGRITINLDGKIAQDIARLAERNKDSKNGVVRSLLADAIAKRPGSVVIRNREQVLEYSRVIIATLQEALDYDPNRHHNQPPPVSVLKT